MKFHLIARLLTILMLVALGLALPQAAQAAGVNRALAAGPEYTGHEETFVYPGCNNGFITQYHGLLLDYAPSKSVEYYFDVYNAANGKSGVVSEHTLTTSGSGSLTTPTYYFQVQGLQTAYWTSITFVGYYPYPVDDGPYYSATRYCSGAPAVARQTP